MDTIFDFSTAASIPQQEALTDAANAALSPSLDLQINRLMCDMLATKPAPPVGQGEQGGQGGAVIDLTLLQHIANYQRQQQQLQLHQSQQKQLMNPLLVALANMQFSRQVAHLPPQLNQLLMASPQHPPSQANALNELASVAIRLTSAATESQGSCWRSELDNSTRTRQKTPSTLAELLATTSTSPSAILQRIHNDATAATIASPPSAKRARLTPVGSGSHPRPPPQLRHPPLPPSSPPAHSIASSSSLSSSTQNSPQLTIKSALVRRPSDMSTTSTNCSSPISTNRGSSTKNSHKVPTTPTTTKTSSTPQRKPAAPIPPEKKDASYYERRRKNNDAAKRSRDSRRQKEDETAKRAEFLEEENAQLKSQIGLLKAEIAKLHVLLITPSHGSPTFTRHHHIHQADDNAYAGDSEHDTAALTLEISHATLGGDGQSDNGAGTSSSGGSSSVDIMVVTTDVMKKEDV